jgi:hypothetical protein
MIEWTSSADLATRLSEYPPIGVRLRPFLHAKYDDDPAQSLPISHQSRVVDGLGKANTWCGFVGTLPFMISTMAHPLHFGLEVAFPIHSGGDRVLLDALSELALPAARSLYFDAVPIVGGFALVSGGAPIYSAKRRDDALLAAAFAERVADGPFTVEPAGPGETHWLAVGPLAGPYVSDLEVFASEDAARTYATERSRATGERFEVRTQL